MDVMAGLEIVTVLVAVGVFLAQSAFVVWILLARWSTPHVKGLAAFFDLLSTVGFGLWVYGRQLPLAADCRAPGRPLVVVGVVLVGIGLAGLVTLAINARPSRAGLRLALGVGVLILLPLLVGLAAGQEGPLLLQSPEDAQQAQREALTRRYGEELQAAWVRQSDAAEQAFEMSRFTVLCHGDASAVAWVAYRSYSEDAPDAFRDHEGRITFSRVDGGWKLEEERYRERR